MKRIRILFASVLVVFFLARPTAAQQLPPGFDETFSIASLNPLLTLNADAVVRLDWLRFEVASPKRATQKKRRVVTVLGPDGREEGRFYEVYDNRMFHLKKFKGQIRDADGKVIRKLKRDDAEDYSLIGRSSIYDDTRVRVAQLYHDVYPYTVEFESEILFDGLINWPTWSPQVAGMPVAYGRFEVEASANPVIRYFVQGDALEPTITTRGKRTTHSWEVSFLPAKELEPHSPPWRDQMLAVHTAPTTFEVEGARGDMSSWTAFGQWYHMLSEGRDVLPSEARAEVERLVRGVTDPREKVRRLYAFMQEKTRYVSLQLGLGGWQPFDAEYVHERSYGDCKALTNYMLALLKEAGIPSFPALIQGGRRAPEVLPNFSSNQFNHVVLNVPMEADTLWLECTSQTMPFAHLGSFTEDRYALLVKPGGSELVRTPRSRAHQNQQIRHATVTVDASGNATATVNTTYTGNQQDDVRQRLVKLSGRDRAKWLRDDIDIRSFELVSVDFSGVDKKDLTFELPIALKLPRYAARTGKRLFLPLALLHPWSYIPPEVEERTQPVKFFPYAFLDADTIRFALPDGFTVEAMPDLVEAEASFGRYRAEVVLEEDGTLVYHRLLEITQSTSPAEEYDAFRAFMRQISQADRAQVVLVER